MALPTSAQLGHPLVIGCVKNSGLPFVPGKRSDGDIFSEFCTCAKLLLLPQIHFGKTLLLLAATSGVQLFTER